MQFVVGGLHITKQMDKVDTKNIINYLYAMQILPDAKDPGTYTSVSLLT